MDNKLKVLLIENQQKIALEIKKELEMLNYKVSTAISTENGLLRAKAFQFNLVVVNCGADGRDGLNLMNALMKDESFSDVPVLFTLNPKVKVDIRLRKFEQKFDILRLPIDSTELRIRLTKLFSEETSKTNAKTQKVEEKVEETPVQKGRVLLVEDNPLNQKVLGMFISKIGFEYDIASNGQMAIDLAKDCKYSYILMDIYMPGMDGTDATTKIREEEQSGDHRAKIIAITANESEESVKRCYDSGMDDFLVKPFTVDLLKDKLV